VKKNHTKKKAVKNKKGTRFKEWKGYVCLGVAEVGNPLVPVPERGPPSTLGNGGGEKTIGLGTDVKKKLHRPTALF